MSGLLNGWKGSNIGEVCQVGFVGGFTPTWCVLCNLPKDLGIRFYTLH